MSEPLQEFLTPQLTELWMAYVNLDKLLVKLAGKKFDGREASISHKSKLWAVISFREFCKQKLYTQQTFMQLIKKVEKGAFEKIKKNKKLVSLLKMIPRKSKKWVFRESKNQFAQKD